jgi:hypothetical protein
VTIERRAAKLGASARKAYQALHGGNSPTLENDDGAADVLWSQAWDALWLHGAVDSEMGRLRLGWMDAYFFMATASAGG